MQNHNLILLQSKTITLTLVSSTHHPGKSIFHFVFQELKKQKAQPLLQYFHLWVHAEHLIEGFVAGTDNSFKQDHLDTRYSCKHIKRYSNYKTISQRHSYAFKIILPYGLMCRHLPLDVELNPKMSEHFMEVRSGNQPLKFFLSVFFSVFQVFLHWKGELGVSLSWLHPRWKVELQTQSIVWTPIQDIRIVNSSYLHLPVTSSYHRNKINTFFSTDYQHFSLWWWATKLEDAVCLTFSK